MAVNHSVSIDLSLSLHSSPGIPRSQPKPVVDQKPPVNSALPNLQQFIFTLLSPPNLSNPPSYRNLFPIPARFEDFVEDKNHRWIKKRLSVSDVNDSARLLLGKEYVRKHILALIDEEKRAACESTGGLRVKVWDLDTNSEHDLRLKQWKTGSFLLTSNWTMEFVKRRNLQVGDAIGLTWDSEKLGFFFHKFNA
nr:putative B3 domain-containing protein At1g78640 [Ipomoea trifida]